VCGLVHYHDPETTVPATYLAAFSKLHAQRLQNLHVEITSNSLSRQYELMVHQTIDIKELQELFDCPSNKSY
jgi:hypothetical protein